jgi:hypothetical protein
MANYDALKTVMSSVAPSATSMDAYTPTNSPAACPDLNKSWQVKGESLPPTPDASLCECMFASLSCVPASSTSPKDYGDIFNYVCSETPDACAGISGNTTSGVYGAFSMCNATQQLGYVLDQYYKSQNNAAGACDFEGKATIQRGAADSTCSAALSSASAGATSTSGADSQTSSNAAVARGPVKAMFGLADAAVGLYVLMAMGVGAGMVLL